jgi:hypothetical protein
MKLTTVHLTDEQLAALKKEAERSGNRVSVLIRSAISAYLRRLK